MGKKINKIAIMIALIHALSMSPSSSFNDEISKIPISPNKREEQTFNNTLAKSQDGKEYYLRYDKETGAYKAISIFDEENIISRQYGANQMDFDKNFDNLIKNPLIWQELQDYYPVSNFKSEEEAKYFYKLLFKKLSDSGCGYAVVTDFIFTLFEGKEKEFEETFGFPMYTVDEQMNIDFNYEILMLKFFNYSSTNRYYKPLEKENVYSAFTKDLAEYRLNEYKKNNSKQDDKYDSLYKEWNEAENKDIVIGVPLDSSFGKVNDFLNLYGINITSVSIDNIAKTFSQYDIIASDNIDLYGYGYKDRKKVKLHYVFVTGTDSNNNPTVSSWGLKFSFDDKNAHWVRKLTLK